jgi:hypothetical protein
LGRRKPTAEAAGYFQKRAGARASETISPFRRRAFRLAAGEKNRTDFLKKFSKAFQTTVTSPIVDF